MLSKKRSIENHKQEAEKLLTERTTALQTQGVDAARIQRDARVRHLKGRLRQAKHQLADIAALEAMLAQRAEKKAAKLAAPKVDPPKKRSAPNPAKREARQARRKAADETAADA